MFRTQDAKEAALSSRSILQSVIKPLWHDVTSDSSLIKSMLLQNCIYSYYGTRWGEWVSGSYIRGGCGCNGVGFKKYGGCGCKVGFLGAIPVKAFTESIGLLQQSGLSYMIRSPNRPYL